jgi:hypothetical protein
MNKASGFLNARTALEVAKKAAAKLSARELKQLIAWLQEQP